MKRLVAAALVACLAVSFTASARAESLPTPKPLASQPPPPTPTWRTSGSWGWFVVASGLAAGAGLSAYGLSFDCSDTDRACQRNASVAIWGGIGIAALSTALGVTVVQLGRARVQVAPSVAGASREVPNGVIVRASF